MKKLTVLFLVLAAYVAAGLEANAHAIWIQSNPKASKNKAHEVNVFYGEYPEGKPDSVGKWYSDLKDIEVWVISPSQKKTKLELKDVSTHLTSSFVPDEDGVYYISTVHSTKDLGGTTKYEFSSLVPVAAGSAAAGSAPASPLAIISEAKPYKASQPVELQIRAEGQPLKKGEVSVMSPEGWVKTLHTDENGKVSFVPQLKGRYVIEATSYKKEAGKWNEKDYTHTWKGSTTSFVVN